MGHRRSGARRAGRRPRPPGTGTGRSVGAFAGQDGAHIGELAGRGPAGVRATTEVDTLFDTDADCVVYSPLMADTAAVNANATTRCAAPRESPCTAPVSTRRCAALWHEQSFSLAEYPSR